MTPLLEKFHEIESYCTKLAEVGYDHYHFYRPVSMQTIEEWEQLHHVRLPADYRSWLCFSDGFSCSTEEFLPLSQIRPCPLPEYSDYLILGNYGGDGSLLLADPDGGFYKLDHSRGLIPTIFEKFLDKWVVMWLKDGMLEAGLL